MSHLLLDTQADLVIAVVAPLWKHTSQTERTLVRQPLTEVSEVEIAFPPQLEPLPRNELGKADSFGRRSFLFIWSREAFRRRKFNSSGASVDLILNQSSHAKGFLIQWQPAADTISNRPKKESWDGRKVKQSCTSERSQRLNRVLGVKEALLNIQKPLLVYS